MIDFHTLRGEIKQQLLGLLHRLDVSLDPIGWSWLCCAFAADGTSNNPSLGQALNQAKRWLTSEDVWKNDNNLSCIGLLYQLLDMASDPIIPTYLSNLEYRVTKLYEQVPNRYTKLNNPDYAFGLAHLSGVWLSSSTNGLLGDHFKRCVQSENIRLAVLFAAATNVLGNPARPLVFDVTSISAHEIIPLVWLAERYPTLIDGEQRRIGVWEAFERLKDGIALNDLDLNEGTLHTASPIDIAMLYEAVVAKTNQTDLVALFNNMPWHASVRMAAGSLFLKGEYVAAVFEAAKMCIDEIKTKMGNPLDSNGRPLDGGPLITYTFGSKSPRLKFTTLKSQTEQNEHRGLALIAEGMVSAIRNPKGHLPGTAISLSAEEALEQLATISYLMRRIDNAIP